MIILAFVFQSGVQQIRLEQLRLNCPLPLNGAVANNTNLASDNVTITYIIDYDADAEDYHVTVFKCAQFGQASVATTVYTADITNNWFDVTAKASGYMFYISETITAFSQKLLALGNMIYLMITAPSQVTSIAWFTYLNLFLFFLIGVGIFMAVRG